MTPAVIGGAAEAEVVRVGDDCKRHVGGQRERVQRLQLALALLHDEIHAHDLGQHGGEMLQHALPAGQRRHVTGHDGDDAAVLGVQQRLQVVAQRRAHTQRRHR